MANETIKELVMVEIARRCSLIKEADGYWTTVRVVERTHDMLPTRPTSPTIYVYEGMEQKDDDRTVNFVECSMPVGIVYVCESYPDKTKWANRMAGDVAKAMGTEFRLTTHSSAALSVYFREKSTDIQIDDTGGPTVIVAIIFEAQYRHTPGDPTDVRWC